MTADRLREAAAKLRGLAAEVTKQTPAPWGVEVEEVVCKGDGHAKGCECPPIAYLVHGTKGYIAEFGERSEADFMATMDPVVALAVADWLDDTARQVKSTHPVPACDLLHDGNALAVAEAVLA